MNDHTKPNGAQPFLALEIAYQVISVLRGVVLVIRREDAEVARQIVRSASSVAANLAEGNGRVGADRRRFFRIAAGSAHETRAHLRVANTWGWLEADQYAKADALLDRQLAVLWKLTH